MIGRRPRDARPSEAERAVGYTMRKRLFRLGDDFTVADASGTPVLEIRQRLFRPRATFALRSPGGRQVGRVQRRLFRLRETMAVERGGRVVAEVRRRRWNPVVERFDVSIRGRPGLVSVGSRISPDYRIERGESHVADVAQVIPSFRDTYRVAVGRGEDATLLLGVAHAINELSHSRVRRYGLLRAIAWQGAAVAMKIALDRSHRSRKGSWKSVASGATWRRASTRTRSAQPAAHAPDRHATA